MVQIRNKMGVVQFFEPQKIIDSINKVAGKVEVDMSNLKNNRIIEIVLEKIQNKEVVEVVELHSIIKLALDEVDYRVAQAYRKEY